MVSTRRPRPLLWSLVLLAALCADSARAERLRSRPERMATDAEVPYGLLTAPADGEELEPGTLVEIAWQERALPARVHEWEAFLSIDGGRTYPLRITPHLSISIRRVAVRVPYLPTHQARLLLRFGDEVEETGFEMPHRFTISADRGAWTSTPHRSLSLGEKPREGDRGVVAWTEGSMDGGPVREVVASGAVLGISAVHQGAPPLLPLLWPSPDRRTLPPPTVEEDSFPILRAPAPPQSTLQLPSSEIRLLIHRFNE